MRLLDWMLSEGQHSRKQTGCAQSEINCPSRSVLSWVREKKMKQREMAELLDCTVQHYQRIEYGKVNVPATTVIFLADYFGVTADYLLGRTGEEN